MPRLIHWFRRDLRLSDNTALAAAARASGGSVLPIFILDDVLLHGRAASPARTAWLLACLRALDAKLRARGSRLLLRRGEPRRELLALAQASGATGVYWNRDETPYALRRDAAVAEALGAAGLLARSFADAVVVAPDEILSRAGHPYTVYTPYARRWRERVAERGWAITPVPTLAPLEPWPDGLPIPSLEELGLRLTHGLPPAGEGAAQTALRAFVTPQAANGLAGYAAHRDRLDLDGTSRLSPYMRFGALSPRQCLQAAADWRAGQESPSAEASAERWVDQLIWREFFAQILAHFPHVLRGAFRPAFDALAWENDAEQFAAWQEGRTGYPIVDAAMRQLRQEGWLPNRARMIVAAFLSKDLLTDWRWGERHFMRLLVDGDPALNNGGWQWAAGTGTDAQPFFRIFNPTRQGERFDPEGQYVRRYVPELARVPTAHIHRPERLSEAEQRAADVQIGRDYPRPIVAHAERRQRALALYRAAQASGRALAPEDGHGKDQDG